MSVKIQIKRANASAWTAANPTLAAGEWGMELDTGKLKIGTGALWNSTDYFSDTLTLNSIGDITISDVQDGDFLRYSNSASAWINDPVNLSTDTVGDYVQNLVAGTGVFLENNSGEGSTPTIAIGQEVGTSASVTFATVTADLVGDVTGNASTATALETARTISLAGDLSGSASFNGTSDITISASVVDSGVSLDEISDVVIASPIQFQGLMYDGTNWVNSNIPDTYLVRNNTGSTILKGTLVGAVGAEPSGRIDVAPFEVTGTENSELRAMGIVTSNISSGVNGAVMSFGTLTGLDTRGDTASALAVGDETWAAGDILFAHPTVAGKLTNVKPQHDLAVAFITVRHASAGQIAIRIIPGNNHLEWMHDVVLTSPTDGQFLRYNSASTVWVNDTINLGTDTAGDYVTSLVAGTGVTLSNNSGESASPTIAIGQAVETSSSVTFGQLTVSGQTNVGGHVIPSTNIAYDLGSETNRFRDIYLSGTSINLGGVEITSDGTSISIPGGLSGDVSGNADTASTLETARTFSLAGDLSGSVSFDGSTDVTITATVQPDSVALGTDTTGNFMSDVVAGTGVSVTHTPGESSSASIAIGQDVATSASVTFAKVTISGDLTVSGTTTTINTEELLIEDNIVTLNSNVVGAPSTNAGIEIERGDSANVQLRWNETTDSWETTDDGSTYKNIAVGQDVETSASVTFAAVTAPLIGNADTASALDTARVISLAGDLSGSVSFDGSQNVTITATVEPDSVALGTDTTGNFVNDVVSGTGVTVTHTPGEGSSASIAIGQDVATSASVTFSHVSADVTGNVTGDVDGNASSATALETSRKISLSGDLSGSVSFDGTADVTISATVQPDSVALGTDTTGNYVNDVTSGTGVTVTHTPGEGSSPTIAIGQDVGTSASVTFAKVTAEFVGDVTGNSDTATSLETARVISLGGDLSGSVSFDGTTDVTISATVEPNSVALGTDTTGNYVSDLTQGTGVTVTHTPGEGSSPTIAIGQAVGTSASVTFAHVSADLTGDVTGNADTATALQNARVIALSGDVSGSVSFDGTGNVDISTTIGANSVSLGADTSGDYVSSLVAGTGVTLTNNSGETATPTVAIGQDVATSASVTFAKVDTTGDVTVGGNLTVNGTTTTLNTETLAIEDNIVTLNSNATGSPALNAGIEVERGDSTNVVLRWNESTDKWETTNDGSAYSVIATNGNIALGTDTTGNYVNDLTAGTGVTVTHTPGEGSSPTVAIGQAVGTSSSVQFAVVTAPLIGNVTGNLTGDVTGNSDTATSLETARTISLGGDLSGSASFDGTSNVTITATVQPDSVALGTDTTGNFMSDVVGGTGVTISHTPGESSSASVSIGQDVATSASVTFAAVTAPVVGNVTGDLTGNADTATALETARTISLTGDISGSVSFDGTGDVSITATVQPDSVALGTDTTGNYVNDLTGGTGVTITHTPGEGSNPTVAIGQSVETSASVTFAHVAADLTGNVTGNVTGSSGSTTGNAATATALQNARTISLSGDVSGSVSFDGTSNVSISATVQPDSVALGTDTTGNFVNDLTAGTGVTVTHTPGEGSSPTVAIGQSVATSASVTFAQVDTTGDVVVGGNLTVNGTTTTLNTETLAIEDNIIVLNNGVTGSPTTNAGIEVERGTSANVALRWNETSDKWELTEDGATYNEIATNDEVSAITISILDDIGDVSASAAASGDFLKYDGAAWVNDPINLGTDTVGNYMSDITAGTGLTVSHTPGEGSSASVALNAALDDLSDVSASAPADGEFLKYVSASSAWVPASIPTINALDDIGDVNATSPTTGYFLKWDGSAWVPAAAGAAATTTSLTTNSATTIDSFDKDTANAAEFTVKVEQGTRFLSNKVLVLHNGTTADFTKYGEISIAGGGPVPGTGGITWTTQISNFPNDEINSVAYGDNLWVAAGGYSVPYIFTSPDAITWTTQTSNFGAYASINSVAYGNSLWVAGGRYGELRTSTDAITWTTRTSNFGAYDGYIRSVAYGNNLWVVGGDYGNIRTSTDTITWTTRTSNFDTQRVTSVAYGNNLWVIGGWLGNISTSTDGTTWTTRTSNFGTTDIFSVAYGNGLWVAGGRYGELRTSTDAITWTTQTSNFGTTTIRSIAHGNNLWVAGGYYGELRTSTDAITWTTQTSNFDTGLYGVGLILSVAYGEGLWVAGGSYGQIRTSSADVLGEEEIPLTLSADISGSDVRLRATITDAATTTAIAKVLKTIVEE